MDDLIRRSDAIESINEQNIVDHMDSVGDTDIRKIKRAVYRILFGLPSAQKTGSWILSRCSRCGHMDVEEPDYCSRCGSYNGGECDE